MAEVLVDDIEHGEILIDDVPIKSMPQTWLRRNTGIMLQDPWVFTDTITENIRMRDSMISLDVVDAAAKAVGADTFIKMLPAGYDTQVSER